MGISMNAREARILADNYRVPRDISKYVKHCQARIHQACCHGEYAITNPLAGLKDSDLIGVDELQALWEALRADGYLVEVPALGNTWLRAYVRISWNN